MKAVKRAPADRSRAATILLHELHEECETVARLIRRLDAPSRSARERDEILGELSAAVLHLHAHTEGLADVLCTIK